VERRRQCSLAVLGRNRAALAGRAGRPWLAVAKRLAIIHYEAVAALWGQKRPWAAMAKATRLIPEAFAAFPRMGAAVAWAWVMGVFLGYIVQFDAIMAQILTLAVR
jgi:hypothetical protein